MQSQGVYCKGKWHTPKESHGKMLGLGGSSLKKKRPVPKLKKNVQQEVAWMLLDCRHAQGGTVWPMQAPDKFTHWKKCLFFFQQETHVDAMGGIFVPC